MEEPEEDMMMMMRMKEPGVSKSKTNKVYYKSLSVILVTENKDLLCDTNQFSHFPTLTFSLKNLNRILIVSV